MSVINRTENKSAPAIHLPLWTNGDTNAAFGLGFNVLVNVLVLSSLSIAVIGIPSKDVYGTILPALGIQLLIGNVYYTYLARRLSQREGRDTVTAMPYGPSVPHMFIVTFLIMLPIYLKTKSPIKAWETGLAWAFIIGVIVLIGAFVGPYVRRFTPRAAMLGTLAGISLTFISMRPAAQMWATPWIALPVLMIIMVGFFANVRLPFGLPVGLVALLVGTAIGWVGGYMSAPDVSEAAKNIAVGPAHAQLRSARARPEPHRAATGHRDPTRHLQLHRGHVERRERGGGGRQLQPAQRAARRRDRRHRRVGVRLAVPARGLHRPPGLEGRRRPDELLAWPAA